MYDKCNCLQNIPVSGRVVTGATNQPGMWRIKMSNEIFARALGMNPKNVFKADSAAKKAVQSSLDVVKSPSGYASVFKNDQPKGVYHGNSAYALRMGRVKF